MNKISIPQTLSGIKKPWNPALIAQVDGAYDLKIAKIQGEFVWHAHLDTDELFYILSGRVIMYIEDPSLLASSSGVVSGHAQMENGEDGQKGEVQEEHVRVVELEKGDVFVVPMGTRHKPTTGPEGAEIMMLEKVGTVNTGDVGGERTVEAVDVRY